MIRISKITTALIIGFLSITTAVAQTNIFAFFEYDIKDGLTDQFINGYAKDLEWHASQNDDWSWIGWFVLNGERRGRFIDATPGHSWADFDNWKVNSAENARHNKIHWLPYVENASGSYRVILEEFSNYDEDWVTAKFLQVYHIQTNSEKQHTFINFLIRFKEKLSSDTNASPSFVWMRPVSGGNIHEYDLFVALDKVEQLKKCENLFLFSDAETAIARLYSESVLANSAEMWSLSEKLTLIAD